ncbi:MAG: addiction module toxin, HicA family [Verrucomicrobia bacterium]|nr:MAG: addiction module toxin, HicA family [Verrucomicrobiota bacterium]
MPQHLRRHGCVLKREGGGHSIWRNPQTNEIQAVPRHTELSDVLARKICRKLSLPEP